MFEVFVMTHDISVMGKNKVKKKKNGAEFFGGSFEDSACAHNDR